MQPCYNCETFEDVQKIPLLRLPGGGDERLVEIHLCLACVKLSEAYCPEHGTHLFHETKDSAPEHRRLRTVCRGCCLEEIKTLPKALLEQHCEMLRMGIGEDYAEKLKPSRVFLERELDLRQQILFALLVVHRLRRGGELEEAIITVIVEDAPSTTVN